MPPSLIKKSSLVRPIVAKLSNITCHILCMDLLRKRHEKTETLSFRFVLQVWIEKVEWFPPHRKTKDELLKPKDVRYLVLHFSLHNLSSERCAAAKI